MSNVPTASTRHAMIRGSAALAALAAPLAPALASPVAADPGNATLHALGREWEVVRGAFEATDALSNAGWDEWRRLMPATPDALLVREGDAALGMLKDSELEGGRRWYDPGAVERLRKRGPGRAVERTVTPEDDLPAYAHTVCRWVVNPEGLARAEEVIATHDAWRAELNALNAALDLDGLEARLDEAHGRLAQREDRMMATRATTLAGFTLNARVALWHEGAEEEDKLEPSARTYACSAEMYGASIMRDLLALGR